MEGNDIEEQEWIMLGVVNLGSFWSMAKLQALYANAMVWAQHH